MRQQMLAEQMISDYIATQNANRRQHLAYEQETDQVLIVHYCIWNLFVLPVFHRRRYKRGAKSTQRREQLEDGRTAVESSKLRREQAMYDSWGAGIRAPTITDGFNDSNF